ncbi:hypothetical protein G7054_g10739 [Neopestalotiopsis clavispora]|nr:hypothetical protein G7054_g10739 [Neopestalotiopsis clavispora]
MGENPLLEKEELRHWGDSMSTFMDIRQWDGRSPAYLWDTKNRVTTLTDRISTPLDYICISHTWGRWRKPGVYVHVEGVPWPVPANTLYDVEDLPSILERFLAPTERYIWIDLFCMPQGDFDPAKLGIEIDKQASIFGRSQRCIAWLHDVEEWTGVTNAMRYMAATYVRNSSTDDGRGLGLLITQEQLQTAHADADRHMELMEAGKWAPSTWFSSLWTLQEAVLCPDLQLCSKKMEILKDGRDCPIGLRTLFMITTSHPDSNLTIPVSSTLSMSDAAPNTRLPLSVLGFEDLSKLTRFGSLLLHLYPTDVLIQTSVRQCSESRAPAIMSALAITDWDKTYDESTINQSLILNSFPLQFVQAAARKIGATFFYNYSSGPQKSIAERSALRHELDVGSMLPFSEPNELRTTIKMGAMDDLILKPIDHESVASWSILPDGGVDIPSASIMASSDSIASSEALIEASIPLDPRDGLPDLGHLKDPNTSLIDLKKGLVELAGDKYDCFAVVLFEDLGRQHGIVLRGPHADGGATRQFIKIGLFRTYDSMKPPESVAVSWKVL